MKARSQLERKKHHIVPPIVHSALRSPSRPLDPGIRSMAEQGLGHDLSRVRIHSDRTAAESSRAIGAQGYTLGQDIVLNEDHCDPRSTAGRWLLFHELTHVVQQGNRPSPPPASIGPREDPAERKASDAAHAFLTSPLPQVPQPAAADIAPGTVQRGWPIFVVAGVAIAAGVGAYAAYKCLKPCEKPMYMATYGAYSNKGKGGFRLWYFNKTKKPVPNRVWDAFGHCFVACCGTKRCGATVTAVAGKGREFYREYLDSQPHDSYEQDTNNQTTGRTFGDAGKDCTKACRSAALSGTLDLSAPIVAYWTPTRGHYFGPMAGFSKTLKSDSEIRYWVKKRSLSSLRALPVSEKKRMINRLLDGWVADEDIDAIEKICNSVKDPTEMRSIDNAISPRATELGFGQRVRLRSILGRKP
jgi:hypothetical protein